MTNPNHNNKNLWGFFVLTYAIAILAWGSMIIFKIPGASAASASTNVSPVGLLLLFLGGLSPSLAGVFMTWRAGGRFGLRNLWKRTIQIGLGWKSYLTILLLPLLVFVARICVQLIEGGKVITSPLLLDPANLIGFTIMIFLGGAISEEFGWRGFALDELLNRWNVWTASLILGVVWAFWHLPLFFIAGTVQQLRGNVAIEFPIFAIWIIALSVLFTWFHINTGRSLFAVLLFHAAIDWFGTFTGTMMTGGLSDRLVLALAYALIAVVIAVIKKSSNQQTINKLAQHSI